MYCFRIEKFESQLLLGSNLYMKRHKHFSLERLKIEKCDQIIGYIYIYTFAFSKCKHVWITIKIYKNVSKRKNETWIHTFIIAFG